MKLTSKLGLLLALAASLLAFAAAPAFATTNTAGATAPATTAGDVTITPAGDFTAAGSSTVNAGFGAIQCDVSVTGTLAENGVSLADGGVGSLSTITYTSCTDNITATNNCTAIINSTPVSLDVNSTTGTTVGSTSTYVFTSAPESGTVDSATGDSCAVVCTFELTAVDILGGTIEDGDEPTLTLSGPVTSDDTSTCNSATLTANLTIDSTSPSKGTGNDVTITT